jgi:hypothetical protein
MLTLLVEALLLEVVAVEALAAEVAVLPVAVAAVARIPEVVAVLVADMPLTTTITITTTLPYLS